MAFYINQAWNTLTLARNMIPWSLVSSKNSYTSEEIQKSGEKVRASEAIPNARAAPVR